MPQTRVLIADSHPILGQGLSTLLSGVPDVMVVGVARSVAVAEALLLELHPDVVILDSDLGVANCTALAYRLQQYEEHPIIIVLSSGDISEQTEHEIEGGTSSFYLRGASLDDLVNAIRWAHLGDTYAAPPSLAPLEPPILMPSAAIPINHRMAEEAPLRRLTRRENQILELLVAGLGHKAIARQLQLSLNTVRTHTRNIQMKLNVHSNVEAVSAALERGIRPTPQPRLVDRF